MVNIAHNGRIPISPNRILYVQYTNPANYPSLEHSSRILADAGWQVLFLGICGDVMRFLPHGNIAVQQLPLYSAGWRQKLHYAWFAIWVMVWALRWRPSWIYASDPLSSPVALLLSAVPGLQIIYHEHDSPETLAECSGNIGAGVSRFMSSVLWARRRLARRAQLCVLPNEQRAEWFATEMGRDQRVLCIWNCPRREEVVPQRQSKTHVPLMIYYHGNISQELLPVTALKAIAMLAGQVKLRIVGYETIGVDGHVKCLQREAKMLGIENCVEFVPAVPRHALWQLAGQCDVGLALMPINNNNVNMRFMIGASNKPFDYMASGLALLVSDLPEWRAMYVEPGYGLASDPRDPASIAVALRWFGEHPTEMRAMGERGRQRILTEWNYEAQFAEVRNSLESRVNRV